MTTVAIEGGKIIVHTPFSNLFVCKSIPDATWHPGMKRWIYPATAKHAAAIRQAFGTLTGADLLGALENKFGAQIETQRKEGLASALQQASGEVAEIERTPGLRPAPVPLPRGLKARLWRHQIAGFEFAMSRLRANGGVMLAMDMGTGKTLTTLALMLACEARLILIACPLRVVPVWASQIATHLDWDPIVVALDETYPSVARKADIAREKAALAEAAGRALVVVVNYDSIWRDPLRSWALKQKWDMVVTDESHRLKSPSGKASLFFGSMWRTSKRIGLTGTPMPHSPLDVYAQFRFIDRSLFGSSYTAFKKQYAVMGGFQNKQIVRFNNLDDLNGKMASVTFRVGKDVLDLPPEMHITQYCIMAGEGARIYRDLEKDLVSEVKEGRITAANAMVKLLRLQQITGGWVTLDEDGGMERVDFAKERLLADVVEDIAPEEPIVVFCRFRADMDTVHAVAASLGRESLELSGRRDDLAAWQGGKSQILAVQLQSGGVGIDLTRARYSIFYSKDFSLGNYQQALSRTHRPGQTRPVTHIHLVAKGTVDERLMRALDARAEVIEAIMAEIRND